MTTKMTKLTGSIAKYMVLTIGVIVVVFPLYIAVVNSLKSNADMNRLSPLQPPAHPDWQNYVTAWTGGTLGSAFLNTFFIIVLAVVGNIVFGTMVAYVLGRFNFPFKRVIMGAYLVAMFIPTMTVQVAIFGIIKNIGLFDTRYAMVLLYLGTNVVQIYIYMQFIK